MNQFNIKDLYIKFGFELNGIGIIFINDKESFNVVLTLLFVCFGFEFRKGTRRRANLIKAKVQDHRLVKITRKGYDEYYAYESEKGTNELFFVFRRDKLGHWVKVHDFTHSRLGYICRYMDDLGKWTKISRFNEDEICRYKPDSEVRGYFRRGNFVVVD